MTAVLLQTELKEAFDTPTFSVVGGEIAVREEKSPMEPPDRSVADILTGLGRLSADAASKIEARSRARGESFALSARKLTLASLADLQIAAAIRDGVLREDGAAFALHNDLVVIRQPRSAAAEQYRSLRTRLLTTNADEKLQTLAIIPAGSEVRAEVLAVNLAAAFAGLGKRTLLIDADLRRPRVARLLTPSAASDLNPLLTGEASLEDALEETAIKRLGLIAARAPNERSQELLSAPPFATLLERARAAFDSVIVLTAPFGDAADGEFVWAKTRTAIVAARRNVTRAAQLSALQVALRQIGTEILGAVLAD